VWSYLLNSLVVVALAVPLTVLVASLAGSASACCPRAAAGWCCSPASGC
jgi:ABC-type glycerol-3-phosphate transport system permease component